MSLPSVDWLMLWKLYHYPFFWSGYVATGVGLRFWTSRRICRRRAGKALLVSVALSAVHARYMFITALPAFAVALLPLAVDPSGRPFNSIFMVLPIAVSAGAFGALLDFGACRLVAGEPLRRRAFWLLFVGNSGNVLLGIAGVFAVMAIRPIEVIA